jgi:[ribosomal protein S5]-alanine N-acetyltransferase
MRTIRTARLRMVPVTPANAGLLWEVLQEPDLRDFQDLPTLDRAQFLSAVRARPARLAPGVTGRFEWLLYFLQADEREPLGWVSMRIAEAGGTTGEIGYSVVRAHRGRGIATEAVAALIAEGFERANLRRIRAYALPRNLSSRAVLRRNGFKDEGTLPHGATLQGQPVDVIVHAIDRDRWTALNATRAATRS